MQKGISQFQATDNAYMVLEIWGHKNVSELQPITHVPYIIKQGLNSNSNQCTLFTGAFS